MKRRACTLLLAIGVMANAFSAAPEAAPSRYTFSWPVGPDAPAPRGGTTRGAPVTVVTEPTAEWQALQAPGISARERDRRAILAMAGSYRVTFDFLEVASFTGDGARPRPYQSWGTEKVYVDRNEPGLISLVHILELRVVQADGKVTEPMVQKHWRQEWRYEPAWIVENTDGDTWKRRDLGRAERSGAWSQQVFQVDESPRYGALGRWQHNGSFSSWISNETARPLPRREWSTRKDYQVLSGTNRHTILPRGWLQEENNLKQVAPASAQSFVGREYGVARYERLKDADFSAADQYYSATRQFWDQVLQAWDGIWAKQREVKVANSDQSGDFALLFELADEFVAGKLSSEAAPAKIRAALARQGIRVSPK
jgi:hypothetical protein